MVKIIFPVPDTENGHYDYGRNLSDDEYTDMMMDDFYKNESDMKKVERAIRENNGMSLERRYNIQNIRQHDNNAAPNFYTSEDLIWLETDAEATTMEGQALTLDYMNNKVEAKDMDILQINFLTENMDYDIEGEIRYWTEDSCLVRKDCRLDSKTRVKRLPPMDLKIVIDDITFRLYGCKIVKDNSNKRYPYNLSLLVNKIEKEN